MCMSKVYYNYNQYGIGYKAFTVVRYDDDGINLKKPYAGIQLGWCDEPIEARKNIWYTAKLDGKRKTIHSSNTYSPLSEYPYGFHIFANKHDALNYGTNSEVVYKIKFKDLVSVGENETFGEPSTGLCFIARKIMLVEKIGCKKGQSI